MVGDINSRYSNPDICVFLAYNWFCAISGGREDPVRERIYIKGTCMRGKWVGGSPFFVGS